MPDQLHFSNGDDEAASAILSLADEGLIDIPDATRRAIVVADAVYRAQREAGKRLAALQDALDGRTQARDDVIAIARQGGTLEAALDAAAGSWAWSQEVASLREALEVTKLASDVTANTAMVALRAGVSGWGAGLADALTDLLEQARGDAGKIAELDFADPGALLTAPPRVQEAYARLVPLAERHDRIRAGVVLLVRLDGDWPDVETFAGHGIERTRLNTLDTWRWRFQPTGHPVARLVVAALAVEPTVAAA